MFKYIICLDFLNKWHFFKEEKNGAGFFTCVLKDAMLFDTQESAKIIASGYDGAIIKRIDKFLKEMGCKNEPFKN